jgi:RND family efflux transporter MFP subunit
MRTMIRSLLVWLAVLPLPIMISCAGDKSPPEPIIRPVRILQVFAQGGSRVRTFSGVAQAGVESKLSFKVPGTIRRLNVGVGDSVSVGQVIAELDPEDYSLKLQDADAALTQARAQERNASASYTRVRNLYENRNASKQDLDQARAAFESAVANRESIEKRHELARHQLNYTRLKAPIGGSIAACRAEANENVQSGQTVVLLTSGSDLEVQVAIPEIIIAQVKEGSPVVITFDAIPRKEFSGRVTEVGVASTQMATTYPVTVRLDGPDPAVRSGMAADVSFRFESSGGRERFFVPPVAVGEDREGRFVFIVDPTEPGFGIARRRAVTVGDMTGRGMEILEGLADGDRVVIAGVSKIHDGLKVKLPQ